MSVDPSVFAVGLSMVLIDGNGWPLSRPEAVTGSYTVTDQNKCAGSRCWPMSAAVIADTKDLDTWDMNRRSDLKPIRPILETLTTAAKALSKVEA